MPLRFVWGVEAIDDGNHLIPSSKGTLHLGKSLNLSSADAQLWMLDFCKKLKQQSFYQTNNFPAILPSCFIENLIDNMNKRCVGVKDPVVLTTSNQHFTQIALYFSDVLTP